MSASFRELYESDLTRYGAPVRGWKRRFHYLLRRQQTCGNRVFLRLLRFLYRRVCGKHGIEIPPESVSGKGLYLGHPFGITVNAGAVLGSNVNLHKGVTIGQENRGPRKGAPVIGSSVWIGVNAVIVGNVRIGDDVMIAPGAFVNRDVPSHSVAVGNPCRVTPRENAVEGYLGNTV